MKTEWRILRFLAICVVVGVALAIAICALSGCSLRAHRGYRSAVTMAGVAAQIVDTRSTQWGVAHGYPEPNPLIGRHPSAEWVALGGVVGSGVIVAWGQLVELIPDRGPETPWIKDFLATLPLVVEGTMTVNNVVVTGKDWREW